MSGNITEQYLRIGKVIVAFNMLDANLNSLIGWLLNADIGIGQIVTAMISSFQKRLDMFFVLYKYKTGRFAWFNAPIQEEDFITRVALVDRANNLRKKASEINTIRNKIVHSYWFQQERHVEEFGESAQMTGLSIRPDSSAKIESGKTGIKYDLLEYSLTDLDDYLNDVEDFSKSLLQLRSDTEKIMSNKTSVE